MKIIITESQLKHILKEDIYSSPQNRRAIKYLMKNGYSNDNSKQIIDGIMNNLEIHHTHDPKFKYMLGLSRLFITGQLSNEENISKMRIYLKYLSDESNTDNYNEDINGLNLFYLSRLFDKNIESDNENSRNKVNSLKLDGNNNYRIVKITNEEQCEEYGKYTSWCIAHGSFDDYHLDDINQCYFCLKNGFENIKRPANPINAPFDEYGLSMVSVIVDTNGNPKYITTRYNHDYEGENNPKLCNAEQVSKLIGVINSKINI